jgi:electron transport complex protein RnfG
MKENIRLGIILAIITSIAGLLLGFVHETTKDAIAANGKMTKEQLSAIMPKADKVIDFPFEKQEGSNITEVLEATSNGNKEGYLIKVISKGFHGPIEIMVGISLDEKITGMSIVNHSETPGVGSKIEKISFLDLFRDKSSKNDLKLIKTPASTDSEIQGISGASVSSTAVVKGVNEASSYYKNTIIGGN